MVFKRNAHRSQILFLLTIVFSGIAYTQTYSGTDFFERPNQFFNAGYYPAALQATNLYESPLSSNTQKELLHFKSISNALRMNSKGTEKRLVAFSEQYPSSNLNKSINLDLGNFYFEKGDFSSAHKWLSKVSVASVPKSQTNQYGFYYGYSLFYKKKYEASKPYLEQAKIISEYASDANYYLGHIAYQKDDYDTAKQYFDTVSKTRQKNSLGYFQADESFKQGDFKQAITLAKLELNKTKQKEVKSQLSKIIGESYFSLKKYGDALPYLKAYKGKRGKWKNEDFYQLGFAHYKAKDYKAAIGQFNKIIQKNSALTQNAYYYLAECYLKTDEKTAALNAFKSASKMTFNKTISQDAFLNYAKLSYEIGNPYESTPKVLKTYLEKYPNSKYQSTVLQLLVDSYTQSKNYDEALRILESESLYKNDEALQKVAYLKAMNLYQANRFEASLPFFEKVLKNGNDKKLKASGQYWLANAQYELNRHTEAIASFKAFKRMWRLRNKPDYQKADYNIAYSYFHQKKYEEALPYFESFAAKNAETDFLFDTYVRTGDSHFALKKYWPAMESYNKAIALKPRKATYVLFQKGISYGFVDRNEQKIQTLSHLVSQHPNSKYADDALFEIGTAHSVIGQFSEAINAYDQLATKFERSPYAPQALLNKGLILYNSENYANAEKTLKGLISKYKKSTASQQALKTLKEIAIDIGSVAAFSKWLKTENIDSFDTIELEQTAFAAAEKQFLDNNKSRATQLLASYLTAYPSGTNVLTARYYLAEIYFENEAFEKAKENYNAVTSEETNEYSEKSLVRLIEIMKLQSQITATIPYLEQLIQVASFEENIRYAKLNLMKAYYEIEEYDKALQTATEVLQLPALEDTIEWDALTIQARASLIQRDSATAAKAYQKLENVPLGKIAAEALYFKAERLHKQKAYGTSNEIIAKIAENSSNNGVWGPKALLLLSENYYQLEDIFQATYILKSVVENFQQYPEVIALATQRLSEMEVEASDENASIELNNQESL